MLSEVLGIVSSVGSASVAFLSSVELTTMVFSNSVKWRILYCQQLRKNCEGNSCRLFEEGHKPTKLVCASSLGDRKNWGLLPVIQRVIKACTMTTGARQIIEEQYRDGETTRSKLQKLLSE